MKSKRMEAIEVYVSENGHICIKNDDYGGGDMIVTFSVDQADKIIEWIKEAKGEILDPPF
jgi:hypothetical protein